jgi:lipopolysaccharide export LptBFGC system permease protein LptF
MKRDADNRMTEVIRADRADWDPERRVWHLDNGSRMRFAASEADPTAPVTEADLGAEPIREYASDLQPRELALQQASLWTSFMSLREIERLRLRFAESGTSEFIKLKHRRLTVVFVNIIMICIGMSFFLNRERASVVVVGGRCMAACALCFVITFFFQQTNLDLIGVPPALAIWLPVLIFGPVAVVLMDGIKT